MHFNPFYSKYLSSNWPLSLVKCQKLPQIFVYFDGPEPFRTCLYGLPAIKKEELKKVRSPQSKCLVQLWYILYLATKFPHL